MRAERKLNESADTCRANRSCIHSRSVCCNGGSEAQVGQNAGFHPPVGHSVGQLVLVFC